MTWSPALTNLRDALASLYDPPASRRVVEEAGLIPEQIDFQGSAVTVWQAILRDALRRNRVSALVAVAAREYASNSQLLAAREAYEQWLQSEDRQAVGDGVRALIELMPLPTVRTAVVAYQVRFQDLSQQIEILGDYKRIHDLMQQLQDRQRLIEEARLRLAVDELAWESILRDEPDLRATVSDLLDVAGGASFAGSEAGWMRRVSGAQAELRTAADEANAALLDTALHRLSRVLTREPSRINNLLFAAAGTLRLSALANAIREILQGLDDQSGQVAMERLSRSVDTVAELHQELDTLVVAHNRWQSLDDQLRLVEGDLHRDLTDLELAWPDIVEDIRELAGDGTVPWASQLLATCNDMKAALTGANPQRVKVLFWRLRSQVTRQFNAVDHQVLGETDKLQRIAEPLNHLLRMLDDGQ